MRFLICDFSSPESKPDESNDEIIRKDINMKMVEHEIDSVVTSLTRKKGEDLDSCKKIKEA